MRRTNFLLKFLAGLGILLLVVQTLLLLFFTQRIRQDLEKTTLEGLRTAALLLKEWAHPELSRLFEGDQVDILGRVSNRAGYRISLLGVHGNLLQDTHLTPGVFQDEGLGKDLEEARVTGEGWTSGFSRVLDKPILSYTLAYHDDGPLLGFIRMATPLDGLNQALDGLFEFFLLVSVVALAVVFSIAWLYSRAFSQSLGALIRNAGAFARGEPYEKLYLDRPRELRLISMALNKLYDQLEDRISTIDQQRNESAAILTGMIEAVIVLDKQLLVKTMNPAARALFVTDRNPERRSLIEVCRNSALDGFARGLLEESLETPRMEIVLRDLQTTLQVQGALLRNDRQAVWGLVLVMIDITQLKRLEAMRRDFVSNVSHELKTPITNILGYVETLSDGAIDNPEKARPFLETIQRHAGRLHMIVDDLLILTRLENTPPQPGERRPLDVGELVSGVLSVVKEKARAGRVKVVPHLPENRTTVEAYPVLLEQALVNLVDNAVKFSPRDGHVRVTVTRGDELVLSVDDEGPGIAPSEIPRIFERFYRTEAGRKLPGTGLGLAIVKHIVHLHRGSISVESPVPGTEKGTRFTIRCPFGP